nr:PDZ domain-containing protein [uncultured Psychroserpens sp.]
MKKLIILITLLLCGLSFSQELGRRPNLGVSLKPLTPEIIKELEYSGNVKMYVKKVTPNSTASNLKIMTNDIIIDYGGEEIGQGYYNRIKSKYREGDNISATVFRNGNTIKLNGKVIGSLKETSPVADIVYDHVDYDGGMLRSIIWKPKNSTKTKLPVIYYVQGFSCTSVEQISKFSNSSIKQLLEGFVKQGYIVYRVEKIGVGDSVNNQNCKEIDINEEIEGFREGLKKLKEYKFVDSDNIYLWGHSLGGFQAPFIADGIGVKGIIGYGYGAGAWHDYIINVFRIQFPMKEDVTYGEMYDVTKKFRKPLFDFLYNKESIEEIISKYPKEDTDLLFGLLGYNGKTILGRSPVFLQSLNELNLLQKHQDIKTPTLSLYGSCDIATIGGDKSVELIAAAINQVAPGNGYYQIIPETNHYLAKVGTMETNIKLHNDKEIWQNAEENFNSDIIDITHNWIQEISSN